VPPPTGNPISVLIADDDRMTRALVRQAITAHRDIALVGEAVDGFDAVAMALKLRPNVVVLDVDMPVLDGIEAAAKPEVCSRDWILGGKSGAIFDCIAVGKRADDFRPQA
jgi:PleD family two-component response regulator